MAENVPDPLLTRESVVLVVDDDPQVLNAVRRCLRNESFEVITAGSSDEALGWMSEVPIGLVIADQVMPGMTGTELIRAVRKQFPQTPCAILTGYRTSSLVREAATVKADTILYKPWSDQGLREATLRLLGRSPEGKGEAAGADPGGEQ